MSKESQNLASGKVVLNKTGLQVQLVEETV